MTLSVYYKKFWREDNAGKQEYVKLGTIDVPSLENGYYNMQGEVWSPNGEARSLIESLGLSHTSMSVGDIFVDTGANKIYLCDTFGFKEVADFPTEIL